MFLKPCLGIILFAVLLAPALAEGDPELNPQHPESYVVVTGDTLWDISGKFLRFPWRWMELWRNNPQIENPNLIYPGDVIAVRLVDGKPVAEIVRGGAMTRVSPTGRGGAIITFTQALAHEFAKDNINVNCVCPGVTDNTGVWTFMSKNYIENLKQDRADVVKRFTAKIPLGRLASIEDVVGTTVYLCSSAADYLTGQSINISGGRLM